MLPDTFRCYLVRKTGKDKIEASVERRPGIELPAGDLLIRVAYSALNYKDALAATGNPGITRQFPHVPGIDATGTVVQSASDRFRLGDQVTVTSYGLGVDCWGGWAEYIRVPAVWALPLPEGLSLEEAATLGTAGLTAGLCIRALARNGVQPDSGEVLVTGATGGVGIMAVRLLARLGYQVVAVSGKRERKEWLHALGATRVVTREEAVDDGPKPLLSAHWAGSVDTVGGRMLATTLRSTAYEGCVACCGLVGGADLPMTVFPFILRGVTLVGIDSSMCPLDRRNDVWRLLATDWRLNDLNELATTASLEQIREFVPQILAGQIAGRVVVKI